MNLLDVDRLADHAVLPGLASRTGHGRANDAEILAFIAVADERRLYLPAAYPSMHQYCMGELHMSEDEAAKRIQAARAVRKFPAILDALADGRLHLSGVGLLVPHLTPETVDALLASATHKSCAVIRLLIAERYPQPDLMTTIRAIAPAESTGQHATQHAAVPDDEHATQHVARPDDRHATQHVARPVDEHATQHAGSGTPRAKVAPLSPERSPGRSPSPGARTTSCAMHRSCWATRCPRETWHRCLTGLWTR